MIVRAAVLILFFVGVVLVARRERRREYELRVAEMRAAIDSVMVQIGQSMIPAFHELTRSFAMAAESFRAFDTALSEMETPDVP